MRYRFELRWPAAWFNDILEVGKMVTFETLHASSSWSLEGPPEPQMSFSLQPRSLNLKHLELDCCHLDWAELSDLLNACRHLEKFYYSTKVDIDDDGTDQITPAEIVKLLHPHKDSLLDLFLNMDIDENEEEYEDIKSLAHFSRLKLLDTNMDMWNCIQIDAVGGPDMDDCDRLSNRLPPNITHVNFADGNGFGVSVHQVRDLLCKPSKVLSSLQSLTVANMELDPDFEREFFGSHFKNPFRQGLKFDFQRTDIIVSNGVSFKPTFLDEESDSPGEETLTKWTGSEYAYQNRKSRRRLGTDYQGDIELTDFALDEESMSEDDHGEAVRTLGFLDVEDLDHEEDEDVDDGNDDQDGNDEEILHVGGQ
jgi:hypothetical protein